MATRREQLVVLVLLIGVGLLTDLGSAQAQGKVAEPRQLARAVYVKGDAKIYLAPVLKEPLTACDAWTTRWKDVHVNEVIPDQAIIRTGSHSRAKVGLPDGSTVTLCSCTTIQLAPLVKLFGGCMRSHRDASPSTQSAELPSRDHGMWRAGLAADAITRVAYRGGYVAEVSPATEPQLARLSRGVITPNAVAFETDTTFLTVYTDVVEQRTEVLVYDGRVAVKHIGTDAFASNVEIDINGAQSVSKDFRALLRGPLASTADSAQIADAVVVPDETDPTAQGLSLEVGGSPQTSALTPDTSPRGSSITVDITFPQQ